MNCKKETKRHIWKVRFYLLKIIYLLFIRALKHDKSKLKDPEFSVFNKYTRLLKTVTYGSEKYHQYLKLMQPALKHHYNHNRHHPEHYDNGLNDMNLIDIIEMFVDWKAASLRHKDGNIYKSIDINKDRFKYEHQLELIFLNTAKIFNKKENK
jgi:hypothetical protein